MESKYSRGRRFAQGGRSSPCPPLATWLNRSLSLFRTSLVALDHSVNCNGDILFLFSHNTIINKKRVVLLLGTNRSLCRSTEDISGKKVSTAFLDFQQNSAKFGRCPAEFGLSAVIRSHLQLSDKL